jgi:hypothetical protein
MIPLRKILTERAKLEILRQQIFSLNKIKGEWFYHSPFIFIEKVLSRKQNLVRTARI